MALLKAGCGALVIAAMLVATSAQAAIIPSATLIANPPGTLFATDTGYNAGVLATTWVSYKLSLATDDGSKISAIDISISGPLNQRWTAGVDPDTELPIVTPTPESHAGTYLSNADSHLIGPNNPVVALAPTENNNQPGPYPTGADTATRDYGLGSVMAGAWGYAAAERTSSLDFAYVVVPKGALPQLVIDVKTATDPSQPVPLVVFDAGDFFPQGLAPLVADLPQFNTTTLGEVVNLSPVDSAPGTAPVAWSIGAPTYQFGFGAQAGAPGLGSATYSIDPATGAFQFNTNGATRGTYTFTGTASNSIGSDPFSISVGVTQVPEPATFGLLGLALVGFAGFRRKK